MIFPIIKKILFKSYSLLILHNMSNIIKANAHFMHLYIKKSYD